MNQLDLKNRNAIVTGGAAGIGLAIAQRLAASGARVSLWDRDAAALEAAFRDLSGRGEIQAVVVDVTDDKSIDAAVEHSGVLGGLDILVNNAGIAGGSKPSWEFTPEEWRRVVDVNLGGVVKDRH